MRSCDYNRDFDFIYPKLDRYSVKNIDYSEQTFNLIAECMGEK